MIEPNAIGIIRPELVATKLAAIRNYEFPKLQAEIKANPRLPEMLWAIQFYSMQPGGLCKWCEDMRHALPHRFGTPAMRAAATGEFTIKQKRSILGEIPYHAREAILGGLDVPGLDCRNEYERLADELDEAGPQNDLDYNLAVYDLKALASDELRRAADNAAMKVLPAWLNRVCTMPSVPFAPQIVSRYGSDLWFMDDPIATVLEMMDRLSGEVVTRLAMTAVTKQVFDALDYAIQENAMVRIEGNSRFGKTESVRTWCDMRPGKARLVKVPSSNSESALHRAVAEALGIDVSYGSRTQRVKERVEFVIKHSGIFLCLDEAAFLLPQTYSRDTAPARLNWVRTEIVDRKLPLALVVTPQNFQPSVNRFIEKTGYAMEQFFGRNHRKVTLVEELEQCDLLAVARIHFPDVGREYLELISEFARVSENYLQAVEAIAKLARYLARRDGRPRVTVDDIEAAASEVIPRRQVSTEAPIKAQLKPAKRQAKATRSTAPTTLEFPVRNMRGVVPDREKSELISADS